MNFSADIDTTRADGRRSRKAWPIACSRWVLPRPVPPWMNSGLNDDVVGGGERPGGGRGDFIGLADDERLEPVALVEIGRGRIALARRWPGPREFPRGPAAAPASDRPAWRRSSRRVTIGSTVRQASASRSPKWLCTQSAMNWLGMTISSSPVSPSNAPSSAGFSQPSNVRAPQSRRRPVRMVSQAASRGAGTGARHRRHTDFPDCPALARASLTLNFAGHEKPSRATRVATPIAPSVSSPPERIRRRKEFSESLRPAIQAANFINMK